MEIIAKQEGDIIYHFFEHNGNKFKRISQRCYLVYLDQKWHTISKSRNKELEKIFNEATPIVLNKIDIVDKIVSDFTISNKSIMMNLYQCKKQQALNRKISFSLTYKRFSQLMRTKKCAYTGILFSSDTNSIYYKSIDRIDNNKGYEDGNVVMCCKRLNSLKSNLSLDEMRAIIKFYDKKHKQSTKK